MTDQKTPQEKKARDMRSTGLSLREIAERLKISRKKVEELVAGVNAAPRLPSGKIEQGEKAIADKKAKDKSKEKYATDREKERKRKKKEQEKEQKLKKGK